MNADPRLTAGLVGVELDGCISQAGPADRVGTLSRVRRQRQAAQHALDAVVQRRVDRPVPPRAELGDHAFGMNVGEQRAQSGTERHPAGDAGHHADVQPLGRELAAGHVLAFGLDPGDAQVALRPADAVAGDEAEVLRVDGDPVALPLRVEAALDLLELERLDALVEAQRHRAQRDVDGGALRLTFLHLEPAAQGAVAFAQLERQGDVLAQLAHVGARQVGEHAAAPAPPVAGAREQRLRKTAAEAEAVAPAEGRRRVEADVVIAQAVAHDHVDAGEYQRRRLPLLVDPADGAAPDHELLLLEEPVRGVAAVVGTGVLAAEVEPGDTDVPGRVAPDVERRRVDQQLLEARLEGEQRARRERGEDARQAEGDPLLGVENLHLAQFQRRYPAARTDLDRAYLHDCPEQAARARLDRPTPLLDVRQNQPVK